MSSLLSDRDASSDAEFAGSEHQVDVATFQGYLQKKSPKGFLGKHPWQRRLFVLERGALHYYKDKQQWAKAEQPIGVIRIDMIRDVLVPTESSYPGLRFDILAVGGHLFELMAPTEKSCLQWVRVLREELARRGVGTNEAIRAVKDEQVAAGYWKKGAKERDLHAHAEKAVPVTNGGGKLSRQNSKSGFGHEEEEEEARERAEALRAMMAEEEQRKANSAAAAAASNGPTSPLASAAASFTDVFRKKQQLAISNPSSAEPSPGLGPRDSPRDPSAASSSPLPEEAALSPEERAQSFLKRQYSLGALQATGGGGAGGAVGTGAARSVRRAPSNAGDQPRPHMPPRATSSASATTDPEIGATAAAAARHSRSTSSAEVNKDVAAGSAGGDTNPFRRRPGAIASYGDSDSDSDTEAAAARRRQGGRTNAASTAPQGAGSGSSSGAGTGAGPANPFAPRDEEVVIEVDDSSSGANNVGVVVPMSSPSVSPTLSASPSPVAVASPRGGVGANVGGALPDPLISSVLWKESPTGLFKIWQKRLFALQDSSICYYKKHEEGVRGENLAGQIPIHQISKVALAPTSASGGGTDFNLYTTEGRIYKLRSESAQLTRQWIAFIQACDEKRLGCTYPGLVVRENKAGEGGAQASGKGGALPASRGRLVAAASFSAAAASNGQSSFAKGAAGASSNSSASRGRSPSSAAAIELDARTGSSSSPTARGASTRAPASDADDIDAPPRNSFLNYLRNQHSLLSVFYVRNKASFPRVARLFLFTLDLLMNLFFVFVFINTQPDMDPVAQVVVIILILLVIEFVIAEALRWFAFPRTVTPSGQMVRLAGSAVGLYALFGGLTGWQWTQLPGNVAVAALVRFIASAIGVVIAEVALWWGVYACAKGCCPCLTLDDGARSLDDLAADKEDGERREIAEQQRIAVEERRAKMKKAISAKRGYREEDEV